MCIKLLLLLLFAVLMYSVWLTGYRWVLLLLVLYLMFICISSLRSIASFNSPHLLNYAPAAHASHPTIYSSY